MRWTIHLTGRDSLGKVSNEFLGDHILSELPEALRVAMQRANEAGAGIQVVREILMPGLFSKRVPT